MINIYDILDVDKYEIKKISNGIEVYHIEKGMLYQEKFIRLIYEGNKKIVYLLSRGSAREIGLFQEEILAISVIIVLCYKNFERNQENSVIKRELRKATDANDIQSVLEIIGKECDEHFYEIFSFKDNAICIIKNNDLYNVYYKNCEEIKEIIANVKFGRASIVLLSYAKLLKNYDELYKKISSSFLSQCGSRDRL